MTRTFDAASGSAELLDEDGELSVVAFFVSTFADRSTTTFDLAFLSGASSSDDVELDVGAAADRRRERVGVRPDTVVVLDGRHWHAVDDCRRRSFFPSSDSPLDEEDDDDAKSMTDGGR